MKNEQRDIQRKLRVLQHAEAVGLAERHVSRQLRLAYLAPEELKWLTCGREASTVSIYDLCFLVREAWGSRKKSPLALSNSWHLAG